jgi:hypothetical protein
MAHRNLDSSDLLNTFSIGTSLRLHLRSHHVTSKHELHPQISAVSSQGSAAQGLSAGVDRGAARPAGWLTNQQHLLEEPSTTVQQQTCAATPATFLV